MKVQTNVDTIKNIQLVLTESIQLQVVQMNYRWIYFPVNRDSSFLNFVKNFH